eukprot:6192156-Pleurochrysis_carterae.AAC.3
MDVRWTSSCVHAFVGEELGELAGKEFACVVAVEGAHHPCRGLASFVEEGREPSEKTPDVFGGFVLVPHHVDSLKPGVVIYDDKRVAASSIDGRQDRRARRCLRERVGLGVKACTARWGEVDVWNWLLRRPRKKEAWRVVGCVVRPP